MKNIFNKYLFPTITLFNSYGAIKQFLVLCSPAATPMTAFLVMFYGSVALLGWFLISYEYSMNQFRKEQAVIKSSKVDIGRKS